MDIPHLTWDSVIFSDPDGGKIVLWPHLPCVRMPNALRPRESWDGLALLASSNDLAEWRIEEEQERDSPGIHRDSALTSGTAFGRLVSDLVELEIDGPNIPDPEQIRLIKHAENARGGMPIYSIEPNLDDEIWEDYLTRSADEQVRLGNLLATLRTSKRWKTTRRAAISQIEKNNYVDVELGAASASSVTWWLEEERWNSDELNSERNLRFASRLRGALRDLCDSRVDDGGAQDRTLLVPIHQAWLPSMSEAISSWPDVELVVTEE